MNQTVLSGTDNLNSIESRLLSPGINLIKCVKDTMPEHYLSIIRTGKISGLNISMVEANENSIYITRDPIWPIDIIRLHTLAKSLSKQSTSN